MAMIRRRNYFIKKKFQSVFFLRFVVLLLAAIVLISGLFLYVSSNTLTTGYYNSTLRIERTPSFFLVSLLIIVAVVGICISAAGIAVFIFLSHRIAGPLYRFEKTLKEAAGGDLTARINLRKTDQLTELKEALNHLIDSLDIQVGAIKTDLDELERLLSKRDDPDSVVKIQKLAVRLKDEIRKFKVTSTSRK